MATYEAVLTVPQSMDETFAFVSDLRNAARWDPRTYGVEKVTDGPIGVGTRFTLTGGWFRMVDRTHPGHAAACGCKRAGSASPGDPMTCSVPTGYMPLLLRAAAQLLRKP